MAKELIDELFSPAVEKQIKAVEEGLANITAQMAGLQKIAIDNTKVFGDAKTINDLNTASKQLNTTREKSIRLTQQQKDLQESEANSIIRLRNENRELRKERDKLSTSTEKSSKKIEEYNKRIDENDKIIKKHGTSLEKQRLDIGRYQKALDGAKGMLVSFAAGIGVTGAAMWGWNKIMNSSQIISDKFNATMGGLSASTDMFFRKIASGDMSNLISDLTKAYEAGKKYAEFLDDMEDLTRASKVAEKEYAVELAKLELIFRDRDKSASERKKALEDWISLQRKSLDEQEGLNNRNINETLKFLDKQTKLSDEEILLIVKDISRKEMLYRQGQDNYQKYTDIIAKSQEKLNASIQVSAEGKPLFPNAGKEAADLKVQADDLVKSLTGLERAWFNVASMNADLTAEQYDELAKLLQLKSDYEAKSIDIETSILKVRKQINDEILDDEKTRREEDAKSIKKLQGIKSDAVKVELKDTEQLNSDIIDMNNLRYSQELKQNENFEKMKFDNAVRYEEEKNSLLLQLRQQLYDSFMSIGNSFFERQIMQIDALSSKDEKSRKKELERKGLTEKQKQAINDKYDKLAEDREDKKRKIQVKQAKFNKTFSALNVGLSTAEAIMKTYAQFGPVLGTPLAIIVGAIGALQLAAVLAQPIPQYAKGRKGGKKEIALVGEAGTEVGIKNRKARVFDKPQITLLDAGESVLSNQELRRAETKQYLKKNVYFDTKEEKEKYLAFQQIDAINGLNRKVSDLKQVNVSVDSNGVNVWTARGNSIVKYIDGKFRN